MPAHLLRPCHAALEMPMLMIMLQSNIRAPWHLYNSELRTGISKASGDPSSDKTSGMGKAGRWAVAANGAAETQGDAQFMHKLHKVHHDIVPQVVVNK